MLHYMANSPDARRRDPRDGGERRVVLEHLARRAADARVRATLAFVAADDPDPELRAVAEETLRAGR